MVEMVVEVGDVVVVGGGVHLVVLLEGLRGELGPWEVDGTERQGAAEEVLERQRYLLAFPTTQRERQKDRERERERERELSHKWPLLYNSNPISHVD